MSVYTTLPSPPEITYGETYVRIPINIEELEEINGEYPPEGLHYYKYDEIKRTYQEHQKHVPTRDEVELMQAETMVVIYETMISPEMI